MSAGHNGTKLEANKEMISGKYPNIQKLKYLQAAPDRKNLLTP